MARPKNLTWGKREHGIWEAKIPSWKYFADFILKEMLDYESYIWRGQRNSSWVLEPSYDRLIKDQKIANPLRTRKKHLSNFKYAIIGRRGINPPVITEENDWWALGQHNGLATPLLDWTWSPYVALYFAFYEANEPQTPNRTVYAMHPGGIEEKSDEIIQKIKKKNVEKTLLGGQIVPEQCKFIKPNQHDNPRLISQAALFSRFPTGIDIEKWVHDNFEKTYDHCILLKLNIPNTYRSDCLKSLNRMNINHLSLFPDVYGSSEYCNTRIKIKNY